MKTCPNCGTLLFDDVMICTKCGKDIAPKDESNKTTTLPINEVEAKNETTYNSTTSTIEDIKTPIQQPTANFEEEPKMTENIQKEPSEGDSVKDFSEKRRKWLEEQNKIKAELASIMSRVGKMKKPTSSSMPKLMDMPQGQSSKAAPYSKPVGETPELYPLGIDHAQPTEQSVEPTANHSGHPSSEEEGLSEFDKKELLRELDDLRNEGYKVSRLEKIIEENPGNAWKAFSEFLDDIENLNKQRSRLESLDTTGFEALTARKNEIAAIMNDPDQLQNITNEIDKFENQLKIEHEKKAAVAAPGPAPGAEEARRIEQIEKFIAAGKDALRIKDYNKALKIFSKTLEYDPNNKEIQFFKKKLEAKLSEGTIGTATQTAQPTINTHTPAPTPTKAQVQPQTQVQRQMAPQPRVQVQPVIPSPGGAVGGTTLDGQQKAKKKKKKKKIFAQKPVPGPSPSPVAISPVPATVPSMIGNDSSIDGPKTAAEFEALGFNAYINKDYPKALEFFEKVLEIDPSFPNVENLKQECLMRLGRA